VVALLWCAISGATLRAMQSPDALLAPAAALLALVLACWKTLARLRRPRAYCRSMIFFENRYPHRIKSGAGFFGIMLYCWSMIFSENRYPLFGIMLYCWSMIFSENRYPLFGIML
jgi:hypothetical protein